MPHLVNKTSAAGYLDFKVILYGNNISKPLDIRITVNKSGKVSLVTTIKILKFIKLPLSF